MSGAYEDPWQAAADARSLAAAREETPRARRHLPATGLPIGEVHAFETAAITEVPLAGAPQIALSAPVDLIREPAHPAAALPAIGVLVRHEQAWHMKGLAAGRLLHSLCLAPGEVTQVAVSEWERGTSGSTTEDISGQEIAARAASRSRHTAEVARSTATKVASGGSTATSASSQANAGAGGLLGLFGASGGGSANASSALGTHWSTGARNAAASSSARIAQSTAPRMPRTWCIRTSPPSSTISNRPCRSWPGRLRTGTSTARRSER